MSKIPIRLSIIILALGILSLQKAYAQGPLNNATAPFHNTLDQRVIAVFFVGGTAPTGVLSGSVVATNFIVRIGGVGVTVNGINPGIAAGGVGSSGPFTAAPTVVNIAMASGFNTIYVQFDASSLPSHPAYLLPGEVLTVSYTNTGNTLKVGGGAANALSVANMTSKNNHAPSATGASDIIFSSEGVNSVLDQCSPVNTDFYRWTYLYSLRFRNSSAWNTNNNKLHVLWGSGASFNDLAGFLSNSGGDPSTTQAPVNSFTGGNPAVYVSFRPGMNIASANAGIINIDGTNGFSYPDNTGVCNFRTTYYPFSSVAPIYSAAGIPGLEKNTQFNSYDFDDQNTGSLALNPVVPPASGTLTSELVCLGTNVQSRFSDASLFNCIGNGTVLPVPGQGAASTPVNNQQRWVRFIYGAIDAPGPGNIPDIRVNGTQVTNSVSGAVLPAYNPNPILAGPLDPIKRGFIVTDVGGLGVPDANGVIQLNVPATATTSGLLSSLITTLSTANQAVGQRFYVTIQYWNVCNPYPTAAPVSITTDYVEIITRPNPISFTPNPPNFCENQANGNYVLTQSGGTGGTYKWYSTYPLVVAGDLERTASTFNPVTQATPAVSKTPGSTTTTNFFLTETLANGCESLPTTVPFKIVKNVTGGTIAHPGPNPICTGTIPAAFSSTVLPTGGVTPGTYTYQWKESTTSGGPYVNSVGAGATTAGPFTRGAALTQTMFFVREATSGTVAGTGTCTVALSNEIQITVHTTPTAGSISGTQTICESPGDPSTLTQTGAPSGGDGSTYAFQWQSSTTSGGPYTNIIGANGPTYNPPAGLLVTTYYVRRVTSGICPTNFATTPQVVVTVNNLVNPGTIGSAQTICAGQTPAGLTGSAATGGDGSSYTYLWEQSTTGVGGPFSNATGVNSNQNYNPPALTTTRWYRRTVSSGVCPLTISNVIEITVNALPTGNVTGGGSVCAGNPAPDVVFTFTGTGPWDLVYAIDGTPQPVQNNITSPLSITNPGVGTYTIVSVTDSNTPTCAVTAPHANITGSATVSTSLVPPPTVDSFTVTAPVCDDGGATDPPDAILDLAPNSVETYDFTYVINGNTHVMSAVASNAAGQITISPPYSDWGSVPGSYVITITALKNTATGCAGAVPFASPALVVDSRPSVPTGAVNNIACSSGGGAPLSVTAPGAGLEIEWSTGGPALASFAAAVPGSGAESGAQNSTFTPTSSATATFYAFTRNTVTNCFSSTGLAVVHTQDLMPANAAAGGDQPALCVTNATLAATAPNNGGIGTWTVPGAIAYQQNFESPITVGTTSSTAFNGWTRDVSDPQAFTGGSGYFEVKAGQRFEAQNTNGSLGGGVPNIAELVWSSPVISLASFATVDVSVFVDNVSNDLVNSEDYVHTFYKLNGGVETAFPVNGNLNSNFADATASATGLAGGGTLQIVIRVSTNGATETVAFDNIVVRAPGSTISFANPNQFNTTVSGLPQNAPGGAAIPTTARWTVASALGVCATTQDDVILTVNALPAATNLTPQLCEDVAGGGSHAGFDLTTLNATVTGGAPGVTVEWFADPVPTNPIIPANTLQTITNGAGGTFFFRLTSAILCQNTGTVTFTVNTLPAAVDKNLEFCENTVGAGLASGIDLTTFEFGPSGVTNGGTALTRDVEWYEDAGLTTLIAAGAGPGQEQNYSITATKTIYAKVIDITSAVTPKCFDVADVVLTLRLRPVNNPIVGSGTVCTHPTNVVLYQVNPTLNPGSDYTWSVSGTATFQIFGGGGTNSPNFFILLKFPGPLTGTVNIDVFETLNGCTGNTASFAVNVAGAPGALAFNSPATNICKNETGVVYSLLAPNPLSLYTWSASAGATFQGASSGVGLSSVTLDFTTITPITLSVTETSSSGCAGSPANVVINLSDKPTMLSSATATVCSGSAPGTGFGGTLNFTASLTSTFAWQVTNITGSVTGTAVGNTGTGNLSEVLTNTSGIVGTVTYQVIPTENVLPTPPSCAGTPQNVVVTVNPEPNLVTPQTKTICSGQSVNYEILLTPASLPGGTNFSWPAPTMSDLSIQGSGNSVAGGPPGTIHITDVLVNLTSAPITATYTITPTSGAGCAGTARTVVITVNPEPIVSPSLDLTQCSDVGTGLTLATAGGSVAAVNYNITARNISAGLTPAGGNAFVPATGVASNYLANDAFTNTGAIPLTVTYTIVAVSATGCTGAPLIVTVTINPEPVVSTTLDGTQCSDLAIGLILNTVGSSVAATSYNITARSIAPGLAAAAGNAVVPASGVANNYLSGDIFTNTGAVSLTVAYTIVPVSGAGCVGNPQVVTFTINPEPVVSSALNATVCSDIATGLTLNTNGSSVAAMNYNVTAITVDPGLVAAGGNVAVPASGVAANYLSGHVFTNTGASALPVTYTVVPVSAAGCLGDTKVITITINPEPVVSTLLDATVCSDLPTGLLLATNGTSIGAATYNITARTIAPGLTAAGGNAFVPVVGVASNYLANDAFNNTGASPLAVTYTVVPVSAGGCIGNSRVITITINPEPVVSSSLDATRCSDLPIALTLNTNGSSVAASTYNITNRTIAGGLTAGGGNVAVPFNGVAANYLASDVFTNNGPAPLTVSYTVVAVSAAGCVGDSKVITITIDPEPVVSSTLNATVCSDLATGLTLNTNGTSVAAFNYNITAQSVDPGLTPAGANVAVPASGVAANYLANDIFTNTGSSPLPVTYTVVPVSSAGCLGDARIITITVNPEPVVSNFLDLTICSDAAIGLTMATDGTSVAAATYNVTARSISPGLTAAGGNAFVPVVGVAANYLLNDAFTNTGAVPLTVTYTIAPVSAAGCVGNTKVITITVNPEPVVSTTLDATVCSTAAIGLTLNTNGTSVAAANYNITGRTIAPGLTAGGGNVAVPFVGAAANYLINDAFTNTGPAPLNVTYTIVPVSAAGCLGNPRVITITINPEPVVATTLDATVCSDIAVGLTLNTNGTSVAAANYDITNISISGGLTPAGANAVVPALGAPANYLSNDKFTNPGAIPLTVTYTVVPTSGAGCKGVARLIVMTIDPEPVVSNSLNATVCSDVATALTLATNGTSVAAATYNITSRNIAVGLTPAGGNVAVPAPGVAANYLAGDVFTNTGATPLNVTYTVVPVSAAGCVGDAKIITITINPEPVVATTLDATVCSDIVTGLTLNTNGTSVVAANYNITGRTISPGLTSGGSNAVVPALGVAANYLALDQFENAGAIPLTVTYTVVPVSATGCLGNPRVITITVDPEPVVSSTLNATVCSDIAIALTLNTNGSSVAAANYNITASSISGGLTPAGTNVAVPATGVAANYLAGDKFTNVGAVPLTVTYTVVPVSGIGCLGNPLVVTITINPEPVLSGSLNLTQCSDVVTGLVLNTNGSSVVATNYNITAISIAAGLTPAAGNAVVPGSGNLNYLANDKFTNTTATQLNVVYTISPVSGSGCVGDPVNVTVTIDPEPVISPTLDMTICSDLVTGLTLNTNGTSVAAANYNITARNIAPGLVAAGGNAVVPATGVAANYLAGDVFTNTGAVPLTVTYTVMGVSTAGCDGDTRVITVTINPEPVVSTLLNTTVCSDLATGLTLNTNGTSVAAANYNITLRNISPGLTPAGTNVAVPASGVAANYLAGDKFTNTGATTLNVTYTVVPVSGAGCLGNPQVITISIDPEPVVSPSLNLSVCSDLVSGLALNTNGTSVAALNYNITTIAMAAGLTAAGGNAAVPAVGVGVNYLANDRFTNTGALPLTVVYTVVPVSTAGCLGNPQNITVTINPEPVVSNSLDATVCSDLATGLTLNTNGLSVAAQNYNITASTVAGGLVAGAGNAVVPAVGVPANFLANDIFTNTTSGQLTVTYTVVPVSAAGCLGDTKVIVITINPEPVVSAGLNNTVCSDNNIGLVLNTNGVSVAASFYDITAQSIDPSLTPAGSNVTVPAAGVGVNYLSLDKFTNTSATPLNVTYTVVPISAAGCLGDPRVITITINPEPVVATGLDLTQCSDLPIGLNLNTAGTSVGAASYNITARTIAGGLVANGANVAVPANGVAANYLSGDIFTNTTTTARTVTYTVIPVSGAGCLGDAKVITITINPEPVIANGLDNTVCSDVGTGLVLTTNGTSVAAANYNVTSITVDVGLTPAGTNVPTANGVAANYLALDKFTNTGAVPLTVQYTVVPVSAASCLGDPKVIIITINPEPVVSTTLDATVCSDIATGLVLNTNGTSVVAATYDILSRTVSPGLVSAITNAAVPANGVAANYVAADMFTNTGAVALTVVYSVAPTSAAGCVGDTQTITITIDPEPVMASGLNVTVCSDIAGGITLNTNGASVAAANYNITGVSIPGGVTAIGVAVVPALGVAANYLAGDIYRNTGATPLDVSYTVVPVSGAGCLGNPMIVKQTVNPEPVLANLNAAVCSDAAIGITLNTNGTSVAAANYNVTAISVAGGLVPAGTNVTIPGSGVIASYIFNDQYTNTTNAPLNVQYTVVPVSAATCLGDPVVVVVTINPEPVVSPTLDRTTCSDVAGGIVLNTNGASVAAASYNITNIVVDPGLTPNGGNATIANGVSISYLSNDAFTNTTSSSLLVTYTVVPVSASGCLGNPLNVVLTVDPEPVIDPTLASTTICSRAITNVTLNTNGASINAVSYNITLVSQDAGLTGAPTTGTGLAATAILNDSYVNVTTIPLKVIYRVVPVSPAGCLGNPFDITVNVNAEPVINPALDNTVCSRDISGIILSTNGTSVAANSYRYVSVVVPGAITADPANAVVGSVGTINMIRNDKYNNTTALAAVVTYEIRGISPQGCEGQSEFISLTVNPEPIMVPGAANQCSDVLSGVIVGPAVGSATITQYELKAIVKAPALVAGGANAGLGTYAANLPGGMSDFLANDVFTNTTSGDLVVTYTVAPIASGCKGTDQTVVLTVHPAPAMATNLDKTVCTDGVSGIVFATTGTSTPAVSYNIVSVTIQPGLTQTAGNTGARAGVAANEIQNDQFQNPGNNPLTVTYRVVPVSGASCLGPFKDIVLTIEPTLTIDPIANQNICSGGAINIPMTSPTNVTAGNITFNYTVSASSVLVSGFTAGGQSNLAEGFTLADVLVNNSNTVQTVTYNITAMAAGARGGAGCSGISVPVVVTVEPSPKIATINDKTVCENDPINLNLTSPTVPSAGGIQFLVNAVATGGVTGFSNGVTLSNPSTLADALVNPTSVNQTVTYTITPSAPAVLSGCAGTPIIVVVTVAPRPIITPIPDFEVCSGDPFAPIPIVVDTDPSATFIGWTVTPDAVVTGESNGAGNAFSQVLFNTSSDKRTVTYTLTARNVANSPACDGTPVTLLVTVYPIPQVAGMPNSLNICNGAAFTPNPLPITTNVVPALNPQFNWVVDNGSNPDLPVIPNGSGTSINQTFTNNGTSLGTYQYTITPSLTLPSNSNVCTGLDKIMVVNVAPAVVGQLYSSDGDGDSFICKGSKDFIFFDFGGLPLFEATYTDGITTTTLTKQGSLKVLQVQPTVTTTYTLLSLKDGFGCVQNPVGQSVTVNVNSTDANFSVVGPVIACSPFQVQFQHNQVAGTYYTWKWFDGPDSTTYQAATNVPGQIIKHTFFNPSPGGNAKYKIYLEAKLDEPPYPAGCVTTTFKEIQVYPTIATAVFPDNTTICSDETVNFVNTSQGVSTHKWFYRVQGSSQQLDVRTTANVSYTLSNTSTTNPIVYEVVYQASNGNCPAADVVTPITVYRGVNAAFDEGTVPPLVGGHSLVTYTNTSVPVDVTQFSYVWDFGLDANPATQTGAGPFTVDYTSAGPKDVVLTVTNLDAQTAGLTCVKEFRKTININLLPLVAVFTATPQAACFPADITITENNSTGDLMEWRVVDQNGRVAATSNADTPVFKITSPGKYSIFLKTSSSFTGQFATAQQDDFDIYETPLASFEARPTTVYVPDTELTTYNFSTGATEYHWDFGDNGTSDEIEPKYTYKIEGVYDLTLIAKNNHGNGVVCADTLSRQVVAKQGGLTKVPNAFTPNPNGPSGGMGQGQSGTFNDVFLPFTRGTEEFNMQIFDRWGNLIFESNNANIGWDGYDKNGKLMPAGVYVYKLTLRLSDGQRSTQIGDITMIR